MNRELTDEESRGASDLEDVEEIRRRVERLEGQLDALVQMSDWKPLRSQCTHCQDGWLVRNEATVRCVSCGYRLE